MAGFKPHRERKLPPGGWLPKGIQRGKELCPKHEAEWRTVDKVPDKKYRTCGYFVLIICQDGIARPFIYGAREDFYYAKEYGAIDSFSEELMQRAKEKDAKFFLRYMGLQDAFYLFPRDNYWRIGSMTIKGEEPVKTYEYLARQGINLEKWFQEIKPAAG